MTSNQQPPPEKVKPKPKEFIMRYARRAFAALTVFATGFIAAATSANAMIPDPQIGATAPKAPLVGDQWWNAAPAAHQTSGAALPLWQFLAFVGLGVLMAVAIVGLGYALSHSHRSQPSTKTPKSHHPLPS
jgi:hypothetical protein